MAGGLVKINYNKGGEMNMIETKQIGESDGDRHQEGNNQATTGFPLVREDGWVPCAVQTDGVIEFRAPTPDKPAQEIIGV
jgi:hypothetical protein